jgi:membrane-bound ClpP family serine protease
MRVTGDRPRKTRLLLVVALLDDVIVIALVALILWAAGVRLSVWAIILIGLAVGSLVFVIHHALVPSFRKRAVTGAEGMIGETAVVTVPLAPEGTVLCNGEYWRARSLEGELPTGVDVEVVAVERLHLEVRPK